MWTSVKWIWSRFSDYCTSMELLDLLGWKSWLLAMVASVITAISTAMSGAPWYLIFGLALSVGLFMLGLILTYQLSTGKHDGRRDDGTIEKLNIYERNTYNWDHTGDPNLATLITANTVLRKPITATEGLALLTPLIGNNGNSSIAINATFVVAIHFTKGTDFHYGPHKIWRAMDNMQVNRQRFIANLDEAVRPGRIKKGPDEIIRLKLPVGKYQVDFMVEGLFEDGGKFLVERSCHIEIYG
jgi:hypothetical protein